MQKVEPVAAGDSNGINSVLRYVWQGQLPYRMVFRGARNTHRKAGGIEGTVQATSKASAAGISSTRATRSASSVTSGMSAAPGGG